MGVGVGGVNTSPKIQIHAALLILLPFPKLTCPCALQSSPRC